MTRINLIPPEELSRQHLIAEYRELPRVFSLVRKAAARGECPSDSRNPTEYVLGKGHVRFFYNKLSFLQRRFNRLVVEMQRRGYSVEASAYYLGYQGTDIPAEWYGDYDPTPKALALNRTRIAERLR